MVKIISDKEKIKRIYLEMSKSCDPCGTCRWSNESSFFERYANRYIDKLPETERSRAIKSLKKMSREPFFERLIQFLHFREYDTDRIFNLDFDKNLSNEGYFCKRIGHVVVPHLVLKAESPVVPEECIYGPWRALGVNVFCCEETYFEGLNCTRSFYGKVAPSIDELHAKVADRLLDRFGFGSLRQHHGLGEITNEYLPTIFQGLDIAKPSNWVNTIYNCIVNENLDFRYEIPDDRDGPGGTGGIHLINWAKQNHLIHLSLLSRKYGFDKSLLEADWDRHNFTKRAKREDISVEWVNVNFSEFVTLKITKETMSKEEYKRREGNGRDISFPGLVVFESYKGKIKELNGQIERLESEARFEAKKAETKTYLR